MEKPLVGDLVAIAFPFSDLSGSKRRPALVLSALPGDDVVLCQVTSRARPDSWAVAIDHSCFEAGSLPVDSLVRCSKLFTADTRIIEGKLGSLKASVVQSVLALSRSVLGQNLG